MKKTIPAALVQEGDMLLPDLLVKKVTKRGSDIYIETRRGTKSFKNNHNLTVIRTL